VRISNIDENFSQYTEKPLPTQGLFISSNDAQSIKNGLQYLAPSTTSTADFEPIFTPK
jgi:hypothetical protein